MADLAALRGCVLADPGDAALRLVYGDALMAAGDPRGELIAIETRLAQAPTPELARRRAALRHAHGAAWWPELATRFVRSRGGLVDAIAVTPAQLPTLAPLIAREPVRTVEIYGADLGPDVLPMIPTVPHLVARTLTADGLAALVELPLADHLVSLDVAGLRFARRLELGGLAMPGSHAGQRLDLAGVELELVADAEGWHLRRDGLRCRVEVRYGPDDPDDRTGALSDIKRNTRRTGPDDEPCEPDVNRALAELARLIAEGVPRRLFEDRCELASHHDRYFVTIAVPDDDGPIVLVLDPLPCC